MRRCSGSWTCSCSAHQNTWSRRESIVRVEGAESYVRYEVLRERLRSVELAAYTRQSVGFGAGKEAMPLRTECVTSTYFPMLGVTPQYARTFVAPLSALYAGRPLLPS